MVCTMGLMIGSPCHGAGHCSILPVLSCAAPHSLFSMAEAVHVGRARPEIKNNPPSQRWLCGPRLQAGLASLRGSVPCTASARRGKAIWAFMETGRGLLNKELAFLIFNTCESRPAASAEPRSAGANTICLLQGWLPPAILGEQDPKPGGWEGCVRPLPEGKRPSHTPVPFSAGFPA